MTSTEDIRSSKSERSSLTTFQWYHSYEEKDQGTLKERHRSSYTQWVTTSGSPNGPDQERRNGTRDMRRTVDTWLRPDPFWVPISSLYEYDLKPWIGYKFKLTFIKQKQTNKNRFRPSRWVFYEGNNSVTLYLISLLMVVGTFKIPTRGKHPSHNSNPQN